MHRCCISSVPSCGDLLSAQRRTMWAAADFEKSLRSQSRQIQCLKAGLSSCNYYNHIRNRTGRHEMGTPPGGTSRLSWSYLTKSRITPTLTLTTLTYTPLRQQMPVDLVFGSSLHSRARFCAKNRIAQMEYTGSSKMVSYRFCFNHSRYNLRSCTVVTQLLS